ncbi:hypothetical protein D3C74_397240 [compost metagenome]
MKAAAYFTVCEPVFCTSTVRRSLTVLSATGTSPYDTETSSLSCAEKARVEFFTASTASTRPDPTRSGPYAVPVPP